MFFHGSEKGPHFERLLGGFWRGFGEVLERFFRGFWEVFHSILKYYVKRKETCRRAAERCAMVL